MKDPLKDPEIIAAIARAAHVWHTSVKLTGVMDLHSTPPSLLVFATIKRGPMKSFRITYNSGKIIRTEKM
jgi:hypothetical protein